VASKPVLAIGLDPAVVDFSAFPGLTPELVRVYIDAEIGRLSDLGYEPHSCLIDLGETAPEVIERALRSGPFDCVVIGAGLREPPERLMLFEMVLNLVHRLAPDARIAFNTNPGDTAEAAQRWIG
jgi:hypothetical protein